MFGGGMRQVGIIAAAGLINALDITNRTIDNFTMVINGAGAAGIACAELLNAMGMPKKNIIMCDTKGVIHRERTDLNQWKSAHAVSTKKRSLSDALKGADVAFGLSVKGAFTKEMMKIMAPNPIVFAMANPDPVITNTTIIGYNIPKSISTFLKNGTVVFVLNSMNSGIWNIHKLIIHPNETCPAIL